MFPRSSVARPEAPSIDQPKAPPFWSLRRRTAHEEAVAAPAATSEDAAFAPDSLAYGFENFGRGGLQLGGLHRDQQWVGAWGGRC